MSYQTCDEREALELERHIRRHERRVWQRAALVLGAGTVLALLAMLPTACRIAAELGVVPWVANAR